MQETGLVGSQAVKPFRIKFSLPLSLSLNLWARLNLNANTIKTLCSPFFSPNHALVNLCASQTVLHRTCRACCIDRRVIKTLEVYTKSRCVSSRGNEIGKEGEREYYKEFKIVFFFLDFLLFDRFHDTVIFHFSFLRTKRSTAVLKPWNEKKCFSRGFYFISVFFFF